TAAFRRALGRAQPRSAPLRTLLAAEGEAARSLPPVEGLLPVAPVVDGSFLPRHPMDAVRSGAAAAVPLLVTTTAEEMRLFAAIDPVTLSAADARTELLMLRPADELARWHAVHGGEVRRVRFAHRSPYAHQGVRLGSAHLVDVPFHLGTLHDRRPAPLTGTGPDVTALGARTTAAFAAFCRAEPPREELEPCRTRSASRSSDRATSAPI
ncbi:carboxylesterase family protein, partial [Spirillospora sp. NPDC049652]